ncbi:lasso peptide biosynthesis PqqD family chaperone [Kutzneria sp. NPDC051319]|uniref:lasso peptide biosynthesis PqqD family chaperone n=1 Tax=Kutzneria sp. NPDC051319 TaxID=3155047 RepID=UPI0034304FB6
MNALAPTPAVHQITTADGTVLLDADRGRFYGLNPTGSAIWQALSGGHSVEQITRDLAARYTARPEQIRADVDTLVAQLRDRGLLHTRG